MTKLEDSQERTRRLYELALKGLAQERDRIEEEMVALTDSLRSVGLPPTKGQHGGRRVAGSGKKAAKKAAKKPVISDAERKRRSDRMKATWAKRKKAAKG